MYLVIGASGAVAVHIEEQGIGLCGIVIFGQIITVRYGGAVAVREGGAFERLRNGDLLGYAVCGDDLVKIRDLRLYSVRIGVI